MGERMVSAPLRSSWTVVVSDAPGPVRFAPLARWGGNRDRVHRAGVRGQNVPCKGATRSGLAPEDSMPLGGPGSAPVPHVVVSLGWDGGSGRLEPDVPFLDQNVGTPHALGSKGSVDVLSGF